MDLEKRKEDEFYFILLRYHRGQCQFVRFLSTSKIVPLYSNAITNGKRYPFYPTTFIKFHILCLFRSIGTIRLYLKRTIFPNITRAKKKFRYYYKLLLPYCHLPSILSSALNRIESPRIPDRMPPNL